MALEILVTTNRINRDPAGRDLVAFLRDNEEQLGLTDAVLYYDFPTYADYDTVAHKPDALLLSAAHGVVAIRIGIEATRGEWRAFDESLDQFCSILIGRLLKSRLLRRDRSNLRFDVAPLLYFPGGHAPNIEAESRVATSRQGLEDVLGELSAAQDTPLAEDQLAEARSVIEGAKALTRPQKRNVDNPERTPIAAALAALEAEIANFDEHQRRAAIVTIEGAQRIRGLAGSGKTVILAMKAAHLHLTNPDAHILVTFYTKSLRASLKAMITRFFRNYRDEDPDWDSIHIRHGWGGATLEGVYADACKRADRVPLNFAAAKASSSADPFDFACRSLLDANVVAPFYDHVLIDEGQDFPSGFYQLCYALAKGARDRKSIIWAYDELQNIFNVRLRTPEELFGTDPDGEPRISLDRTSGRLPAGASNDTVLSKCYRNQREVLVVAHALGFGIYSTIVQLLESREHWEDVGYRVETDQYEVGERISILRPQENSPSSLQVPPRTPLIATQVASTIVEELQWVVEEIVDFIAGGLNAEDIMVVCLDDRHARDYFRDLSVALARKKISTNNIIAPYTEPPFTIPGHVTLSTVYRAKGNESAVVFAMGVDAASTLSRAGRNVIFTALTRTKGWLRVSGIGVRATRLVAEIAKAQEQFPRLKFRMPDLQQVEMIQRDLSEKQAKLHRLREEFAQRLRDEGFDEEEISEAIFEAKDGRPKRSKKHR
jgi:superfamily I DNA and RNA helicase